MSVSYQTSAQYSPLKFGKKWAAFQQKASEMVEVAKHLEYWKGNTLKRILTYSYEPIQTHEKYICPWGMVKGTRGYKG